MALAGKKEGGIESANPVERTLRRFMLIILAVAMSGTTADLLLYDHYQDYWQMIPLALFGVGAITLIGHVAVENPVTLRAFQAAMLLLMLGGSAGIVFHAQASAGFHGELDWQNQWWQALAVVLHSKVPPSLAPGALVQMGLIGLTATYRHPASQRRNQRGDKS